MSTVDDFDFEAVKLPPVGATVENLPALFVEVEGRVVSTNLDAFRLAAADFLARLPTVYETDQDFADAEQAIKACKEAEDRLDMVKRQAQAQAVSIDEVFRTIDAIREDIRQARLPMEKSVKAEKENRKAELVGAAMTKLAAHVASLNARIGGEWMPIVDGGFAESIRGLKSLSIMKAKIGEAMDKAKLSASEIAYRIGINRRSVDDMSLVPDFALLCTKFPDDFNVIVAVRKQARSNAEANRLAEERMRIRAEEEARVRYQVAAEAEAARIAAIAKDRAEQDEARRLADEARAQAALAEKEAVKVEADHDLAETVAVAAIATARTLSSDHVADAGKMVADTETATMTITAINTRLGFVVSADLLESLGIPCRARAKASKLYYPSDWQRICTALVDHLVNIGGM